MQRNQMAMIFALIAVTFIGFGIIIPIMPELPVMTQFHMSVLLALYSGVSFVMSPFWGAWSDRIGRRPVILTGIFGFFASFLLLAFTLDHLWLIYVSRMLGGFFSGAVISCAVAYVADITSNENRTKGMGLVGMAIGLGFVIGPGVGGLLSVFGYRVPFVLSALLTFVLWVVVLARLRESLPPDKRSLRTGKRPSRSSAFRGRMKHLYGLSFIASFTLAGLEATLQFFQMEKIGITAFQMGGLLFASGIVGALIQGGVVRRMVKPGMESRFIVAGLLLTAAGFVLLLFSSSLWNALLFLLVFSSGNALLRPCVTSLISQKTPVEQGVASGLSSSMDSLGRIAGPLLATALFYQNIHLPYIAGSVVALASLSFVFRFLVLDRRAAAQ
jgi:multidrug resistance protein